MKKEIGKTISTDFGDGHDPDGLWKWRRQQ